MNITKAFSTLFISGLLLATVIPIAKANPHAVVVADPAPQVVIEHSPAVALKADIAYVGHNLIGTPCMNFVIQNVSPFAIGQTNLSLKLRDGLGRVIAERNIAIANLPAGGAVKQETLFPLLNLENLAQQDITITSLTLVGQNGDLYPGQEQNYIVATQSKISDK